MKSKTLSALGAGVERTSKELRAVTVKGVDGIRTESLPSDPAEIVRILAERRNKPASKARARMAAEAAKRGL